MIDLNIAEVVVLALFAIILFGPEKLPDLARKLARVIAYLRRIANDARGHLRDELGPEFADLELSDLNPKAYLAKQIALEEARADLELVRSEVTSVAEAARGDHLDMPDPPDELPQLLRAIAYDPEAT